MGGGVAGAAGAAGAQAGSSGSSAGGSSGASGTAGGGSNECGGAPVWPQPPGSKYYYCSGETWEKAVTDCCSAPNQLLCWSATTKKGTCKVVPDCSSVGPDGFFYQVSGVAIGFCMPGGASPFGAGTNWKAFVANPSQSKKARFAFATPKAPGESTQNLGTVGTALGASLEFADQSKANLGPGLLSTTSTGSGTPTMCAFSDGAPCEDRVYMFDGLPFQFAYAFEPQGGALIMAVVNSIRTW